MSSDNDFDLLSDATNAVVARYSGRHYPGMLIQGDTLRTLLDSAEEIYEEAAAGDLEGVKETSAALRERLEVFLIHYERVLERHGLEAPYFKLVRKK